MLMVLSGVVMMLVERVAVGNVVVQVSVDVARVVVDQTVPVRLYMVNVNEQKTALNSKRTL